MQKYELSRLTEYSDENLLEELRRVASILHEPTITQQRFDEHSKASSSVIRRRFDSWQRALELAGVGERYSGVPKAKRLLARSFSDDELVTELQRVSAQLVDGFVTVEVFNRHAAMNAATLRRRFGSWSGALKRAGLPAAPLGRRYTSEDYFENLLAVWTHYGRQPNYNEMNAAPSRITAGAYEKKWGTWRLALIAFLDRVNNEASPSADTTSVFPASVGKQLPNSPVRFRSIPAENRRSISVGLRYKVLSRDKFRCLLCGASPAISLECQLHVDHIVPVAAGGKTIIDNLRTLCEKCNLGKGSKS